MRMIKLTAVLCQTRTLVYVFWLGSVHGPGAAAYYVLFVHKFCSSFCMVVLVRTRHVRKHAHKMMPRLGGVHGLHFCKMFLAPFTN